MEQKAGRPGLNRVEKTGWSMEEREDARVKLLDLIKLELKWKWSEGQQRLSAVRADQREREREKREIRSQQM